MIKISKLAALILVLGTAGCSNQRNQLPPPAAESVLAWDQVLESQIKLLGHRNWIVVVDAAYPLQSSQGITTVLSSKDHLATIEHVLKVIEEQSHIRPIVYLDEEIDFVDESAAVGIADYRSSLAGLLGSYPPQKMLHEDIIRLLSGASEQFSILIVKTGFAIPYTSVFFQLDCKYWGEDSEKELRKKMETKL